MTTIDLNDLADQCESVFIPRAERHFGPRNPDWTLGAVRRNPDGDYPRIHLHPESGSVDIFLSSRLDEGNLPAVQYELAHECVHLLDPIPRRDATYLYEGLATWFQVQESEDMRPTDPRYGEALEIVERLMPHLGDAVRDQRNHGIPMHRIRAHHLEPFFLNVTSASADDLRRLEKPFPHR